MKTTFTSSSRFAIHKQLRLPSAYKVSRSVTGHDSTQPAENAKFYELKHMRSENGGQTAVYAVSESGGPWTEVSPEHWMVLAKRILHIN